MKYKASRKPFIGVLNDVCFLVFIALFTNSVK